MERLLKWLLPLLVMLQVILVVGGVVPAGTALLVGGIIELLLLLVVARQLIVAVRRYRGDRTGGINVERAIENGLAVFLPRKVARLVALEPRVWMYLYRWMVRRRPLAPNEFSYRSRSIIGGLMAVFLITGPVEILLIELLVPWEWVRWTVLILGLYGAIWIAGLYASMRVRPHLLDASGLRLYHGLLAEGFVPYTDISEVQQGRRPVRSRSEGLMHVPQESATYLPVGGRTDITLRLNRPVAVEGLLSSAPPATTIHLAVDDPSRFTDVLNRQRALTASLDA